MKFKVALSFPGEKRDFVSKVVVNLKDTLGDGQVFYDLDFQADLARPNLDDLLQRIYRHNAELVVVFLCREYEEKEWCGLEWRAIRDLIKHKEDARVMFVRFDDADVKGSFSIDGYIDANRYNERAISSFIYERVRA